MIKNKEHHKLQDTEYKKPRMSRPKFYLTLFLTIVVSLSLVVGGTMSYFSLQNTSFLTVDGKEIITPELAEAIQTQMNGSIMTPQQKLSQLMQALEMEKMKAMWAAYGKNQGLDIQAVDLTNALKSRYEEDKEKYQKENKAYYNLSYTKYVKGNTDILNTQAAVGMINIPSTPDSYNISVEYAAENTLSTASYASIDIKEYIAQNYKKELEIFYNQSNNQVINGKNLKVLAFDSMEEADKIAKEIQKKPSTAKAKFSTASQKITVNEQDDDAYIYVQNVNIGEVTPGFTYKNKHYVGLVESNKTVDFKYITDYDLLNIAKQFEGSLSKKEKADIIAKITLALNNDINAPFIKKGIMAPISLNNNTDGKDARTLTPLVFASINNKEFLTQIFNKLGYKSSVLNYMDVYYIISVVKRTNPVYPIPIIEYKKIEQNIKDKENQMWFAYHTANVQNNVKVHVDIKNIGLLVGVGAV